jgi:putative redox protein
MASTAAARVTWVAGGQFDAQREGAPAIRLDSAAETGPSPFDALLCALGSCAAVDVVEILAKRRTPVESLTVDVDAERVDGTPKRLARATLHFTITGAAIDRVHAERAIHLSVNKYCSVRDSLRTDAPVVWTLTLNGETASPGAADTV